MESEKIQELAKQYPEIQELLRDNFSMSVAAIAARQEAWQRKMEARIAAIDSNHTRAQGKLVSRLKVVESRIAHASKVVRDIQKDQENQKRLEQQDRIVLKEQLQRIEQLERQEAEQVESQSAQPAVAENTGNGP